jgi:hypothetical protein
LRCRIREYKIRRISKESTTLNTSEIPLRKISTHLDSMETNTTSPNSPISIWRRILFPSDRNMLSLQKLEGEVTYLTKLTRNLITSTNRSRPSTLLTDKTRFKRKMRVFRQGILTLSETRLWKKTISARQRSRKKSLLGEPIISMDLI